MQTRIALAVVVMAFQSTVAVSACPPEPTKTVLAEPSESAAVLDDKPASTEVHIRAVLAEQTAAWNRADIDAFMTGYWKSDHTLFIGANGVVRGWEAVLARYHRNYPDRKAMGHLTFSNVEVHVECADAAFVVGEYHLERADDKPAGVFTLDFRKFAEGWRIVADHTTAFAVAK
jgi:ketosteroid isomerase-like protein